MALEYSLEIDTKLIPTELMKIVSTISGFVWGEIPSFVAGESMTYLFGLGLAICAPQFHQWSQCVKEAFGFINCVSISFRINPTPEYDLRLIGILRVTSVIMQHCSEDCVLLLNGEIIVLQRIQNKLFLNQDFGKWTDIELAEINFPYELKSLPSPLL